MDHVRIRGLSVKCVVGVRPKERRHPQPVRIDLALGLDVSKAGRSGRIAHTVDYAQIAGEVAFLLRFREYRLIEMATEELSAMLLGIHPGLEQVEIHLEKPTALRGLAESASVTITRDRSFFPRRHEPQAFGSREILLETHEAALYLLVVEAGRRLEPDLSPLRQVEWLVSGELRRQGAELAHSEPLLLTKGRREPYSNTANAPATLFCCRCLGST